jgi:hypothetical protein
LVNFGNSNELRSWLGTQPRHVGIALAARSALRVLPMIGLPSAGALTLADAKIVQAHFRALSVAWIAFGQYAGDRRLRITARAGLAAAVSLPIGTFSTSLAASAARRSAAEAVRTLVNAGQRSTDALAAAISEAFSAEAEFPEARGVWALAGDVEFLAGRDASLLSDVPLWLNRPPTWAVPRWRDLKELLSDAEENWQVWTIWYDDRLDGRVNSLEREVAYVDVRDDLWGQAPAVVNADIVRRIEEYEPPPQPIPPQDIQVEVQPSDIPEGARGPVFSDSRDVEQWLADKSPEWAIVIAARSALRSIPALASESRTTSGGVSAAESTIILPMFRAVCAAWVAANNPRWVNNSDLVQGIVAAEQAIFAPKVRVCPKTLGWIAEFSEHEPN